MTGENDMLNLKLLAAVAVALTGAMEVSRAALQTA